MGCRGSGSESDPFTYLPVNIDRLIWNAQRQFRIKMEEPTSLSKRVFDTDFKLQVVQVVNTQGVRIGQVCKDMRLG